MADLADFAKQMYQPKRTQDVLDYQRALDDLIDLVTQALDKRGGYRQEPTNYDPELKQLAFLVGAVCDREIYDDRRELFKAIEDTLNAIISDDGHDSVTCKLLKFMREIYCTFEGSADD